jgi:hypothetical protein
MRPVLHIVLLRMRPDAQHEAIEVALDAARDMAAAVPGVLAVVAGPDLSVEGAADGHTHAVVVTLADVAARDAYLDHPAHLAVGRRMAPLVVSSLVVDVLAEAAR